MGAGGDDDVRPGGQAPAQQRLHQLQRAQILTRRVLGRDARQLRHPRDLTQIFLYRVSDIFCSITHLVQTVDEEEQAAARGHGLDVRHHVSLGVYLVEDILHVLAEEVPAGHGAQVVEGATLDEDQDVEVAGPELALAPLQAHVLQHRALPDACGRLDRDHGGQPRPRHRQLPRAQEQVVDGDGLGVVIRLGEVLQHLGAVVHVDLGRLLDIVLGHDQLLVETPGA